MLGQTALEESIGKRVEQEEDQNTEIVNQYNKIEAETLNGVNSIA